MEPFIERYKYNFAESVPIIEKFLMEMEKGLSAQSVQIPMIPCFSDSPSGNEEGTYLAIDLGGTNLRCMLMTLHNRAVTNVIQDAVPIDPTIPTGDLLFSRIASFIATFLKAHEAEIQLNKDSKLPAGFIFSFPTEQSSISSGKLLFWGKGFCATGVVGEDVVSLLQSHLDKIGYSWVRIVALCNDTVGTMAYVGVNDPNTCIGLILATGTNACYRERISNIKRLGPQSSSSSDECMVINTEWGAFTGFPRTEEDDLVYSEDSSHARMEKQTSGKYMAMLARHCIRTAMKKGLLLRDGISKLSSSPSEEQSEERFSLSLFNWDPKKEFSTRLIGQIQSDMTPDLAITKKIFLDLFSLPEVFTIPDFISLTDLTFIKQLLTSIMTRSATYIGVSLAAVVIRYVTYVNPAAKNITIAGDGSVLLFYPGYLERVCQAMQLALYCWLTTHLDPSVSASSVTLPKVTYVQPSHDASSSPSVVTVPALPVRVEELGAIPTTQTYPPLSGLPSIHFVPSHDGGGIGVGIIAAVQTKQA